MTAQKDWLKDRVAYLKGLKAPNDQQALLILLAEKPERSAQDEKKLALLIKAEKASIQAAKARQEAANLIQAEKRAAKAAERKARNHRLIKQGVLFDLAGLENRSAGELLGLLIGAAAVTDPQKWAAWKERGDTLLAEKAREISETEKGLPQ